MLIIVIYLVAMILASIMGSDLGGSSYGVMTVIAGLALLIPSLAVGARHLHDTDRSGWWLLIALVPLIGAIVLLVFFVTQGTQGPNQYGDDPYA